MQEFFFVITTLKLEFCSLGFPVADTDQILSFNWKNHEVQHFGGNLDRLLLRPRSFI